MNKGLKEALVNKITSILDNADAIESVYITMEVNEVEIPSVTYRIRERILYKEADNREWEVADNG